MRAGCGGAVARPAVPAPDCGTASPCGAGPTAGPQRAGPTSPMGGLLMSEHTHQTTIGEPRVVAISRITPGEDFNPRQARDPERFAQLVSSVRADGVLQ